MRICDLASAAFLATVLPFAVAADAQPPSPVMPTPVWSEKPDRAALDSHFPKAALAAGSHGVVTMFCTVKADGHLDPCAVASESPGGLGFGEAALELTRYFRTDPAAQGGASAGALVSVPIAMQLPEGAGAAAMPPPPLPTWQLPPGARPTIITNPDWIRKPNGDDLARAYPRAASAAGLEGRAVIHCKVKAKGLLKDCVIVDESPPGAGFGEAALKLSKSFVMRPMTRNGVVVDGGDVRIPIAFRLPAPVTPPVAAQTPPAMPAVDTRWRPQW